MAIELEIDGMVIRIRHTMGDGRAKEWLKKQIKEDKGMDNPKYWAFMGGLVVTGITNAFEHQGFWTGQFVDYENGKRGGGMHDSTLVIMSRLDDIDWA